MAVRKEENGKWTVDVYIENHDGTKKRYKKRGFLSKREAADFEYKIKNSNISSQLEKFSYYLEQYLANSNSSADTKKRKRRTLEIYAPTLIDKPINRITKPNLLTWRNELSELAISTTQKNKVLEYFKAVFKFAYEFYDVKNISIVLQTFRKTDKERMREFETWTVDEFNRFISHSDNLIITAYYTLLFYTGARVGEILALYKSDVDTKAATINISKSIRSSKEGIKAPKTRNSIRKIKIDTQTLNTLLPLLKRKGKWLFGDSRTTGRTTLSRAFKRMIQASGVKKIRQHDLRHSHATILINGGVNIVAVSRRLGHSDINMTLKVYTHLLQESEDKVIEYIQGIRK